jgi:hypothetical protein
MCPEFSYISLPIVNNCGSFWMTIPGFIGTQKAGSVWKFTYPWENILPMIRRYVIMKSQAPCPQVESLRHLDIPESRRID